MSDTGDNTRIERLEEAQMFADRRADLLGEQMTALEQKLREFNDRLRRLEANLSRLNDSLESRGQGEVDDLP
jgi:predicted nuclease with TOPRIM domain